MSEGLPFPGFGREWMEKLRRGARMQQRNLVLILARDLADKLASAAFIVDHEGTLVYFNERCAEILDMTFAEAGPMPMEVWSKDFFPSDLEGRPIAAEEAPLAA